MIQKALLLLVFSLPVVFMHGQTYTLPELNYGYDELEPYIDSETMEIHHLRHHQGYVNNLNKAIDGTAASELSLEDLQLTAGSRGEAIRNNGGGHYNHTLFWEILSPEPEAEPGELLKQAVIEAFGGIEEMKEKLNSAASKRFGSGWAWLVLLPDKSLAITSTPNQDNPLMDVSDVRGIPVLGIDVWEHAYYLNYQNRRGDYLSAIWNVIDWGVITQKYSEALNSPLLEKLK